MKRLELEVKEDNGSKACMAAENLRWTRRTNGAILAVVGSRGELNKVLASLASTEDQLGKTRSLLAEAKEARGIAMADAAKKNDTLTSLQLLYNAGVTCRAERDKELTGLRSLFDAEVARGAEWEKELTSLQALFDIEATRGAE